MKFRKLKRLLMETGELFIEIFGWSFLIGLLILLIIFIVKKPEISNFKIGLYFTLAFKIIGQLIILGLGNIYYFGFININEIIFNFFLNFDWLLIPIIALLSSFIRKIKTRKDNSIKLV